MVRHSQLKSASFGFDGRKLVAVCNKWKGFLRETAICEAVSLKRTLGTFFRKKVPARRTGDTMKEFILQKTIQIPQQEYSHSEYC